MSGQAFKRLHKAAAAGGWALVGGCGGGGVVAALFEAGSCRLARAGLLSGGAAALSALAGALAAGGRARDAWRSSQQLRHVLLCFAPPPDKWHLANGHELHGCMRH